MFYCDNYSEQHRPKDLQCNNNIFGFSYAKTHNSVIIIAAFSVVTVCLKQVFFSTSAFSKSLYFSLAARHISLCLPLKLDRRKNANKRIHLTVKLSTFPKPNSLPSHHFSLNVPKYFFVGRGRCEGGSMHIMV